MSTLPWPEPIAAASDEAALALLRGLWARAYRIDVAIADSNRLLELLGDASAGGPQTVHVVTRALPRGGRPHGWRWTVIAEPPAPEFLLFYSSGSAFPESALIFTGSSTDGWLTFHRRPLVLHRLRQRFDLLSIPDGPPLIVPAPSIREQAGRLPSGRPAACLEADAQSIAPTVLYHRVLAAHFAGAAAPDGVQRPEAAPALATHQERAYERASAILDRYGGVIVADAVGLGKTYIGLRLLERALDAGGRGLVVVPASLRDQWTREMSYLVGTTPSGAAGSAQQSAADNLDLWVEETRRGAVELLSMESLGRKTFDPVAFRGADLVLVDEAHNFRNPATRRYHSLADLVRHSRTVLLTATPINNTLLDLQHLIDLFATPGAFRHLGIADYREVFRRAAVGDGDVRPIISACLLRRTRRFLRTHYGAIRIRDPQSGREVKLRFPQRRSPVPVHYDLAATYGELFAGLDSWLEDLRFPAIEPDSAEADPADPPSGPGELLKIILLKRLESSIEAFRCTVVQQLAWCNTALRAIDAGRILTRPDYRASFQGPGDDPGSQLAFFELMLPAPSIEPERIAEFRDSLEHDVNILTRIHAALLAVGPGADRKLGKLIELLAGPLAGRKVLLFTEFRDTARYLHHQLRMRPHIAQIDSAGARLGLERAGRVEVIERFAPRANGLPEPPERERVDLLIATDVLSEGLNLQDASVVVSYDLPWNPVRLMQRIGRIDRLGALSNHVELHHFVPTHDLDRLLGLMARLHTKVSRISCTLGLDQPVLATSSDHGPTLDHIRILARDPTGYEQVEERVEGPLDPEEQAYLDWCDASGADHRVTPGKPVASAVTAHSEGPPRAVAYWRVSCGKQGRGLWLICDVETGRVTEDQVTALELLRSARNLEGREPPEPLLAGARRACARYARGVTAQLEAARIAGDALSPSLPQCRIAAWLSRCFLATAHSMTRDEHATTDRVLDRLARRFTVAGERELARMAGDLPDRPSPGLLKRLDELLDALISNDSGPGNIKEVATLLVTPAG
ncbi:MAG: DEAD/DEAH box helicase [Gemmatimonadota bacterium]|nr:MAG: DEAD/DEAH box helicase [Gemmatimonadota bacterium]